MIEESYTLILTKGTHLISREAAEAVKAAIARNDAIVQIRLDPFGAVDPQRTTALAVRHVVALTRNPPPSDAGSAENLAAFRRRRRSG